MNQSGRDADQVQQAGCEHKTQAVEKRAFPTGKFGTVCVAVKDGKERDDQHNDVKGRAGFQQHLINLEGISLADSLGRLLLKRGWTLATAESCTGGLLGHKIVTVPGASRYYLGGVVAYDNGAKADLLGVPARAIEAHGAVSREIALAMVRGARARFNASCAAATTGIAGPSGGTSEKPVGTVWIAAATPDSEKAVMRSYPVDRKSVMALSANYALFLLWGMAGGGSGE